MCNDNGLLGIDDFKNKHCNCRKKIVLNISIVLIKRKNHE